MKSCANKECKDYDSKSINNCGAGLCAEELHLVREWFDGVQDLSPQYLKRKDYLLAKKIYEELDFRVPNSIVNGCA